MNDEENHNEEPASGNPQTRKFGKLLLVFALLFVGFIALIVRLVNLQIVQSEKYRRIARVQQESRVNLKAERGDVFDRNGKLLATTIKSYSYAIDPTILKNKDEILNICNLISIVSEESNPEKIYKRVLKAKGSFVWLARGLIPSKTKLLDSIKVRGFIRIIEPKRIYLYGSVGSQVIGFTDIDNNGLTGIELTYDSLLRGSDSYVIMLRNAKGRLIPTLATTMEQAVKGSSIQLTMDIDLQRIAEYELKCGVEKSHAESGTVVILRPETGEILSMASYPNFNPNKLSTIKINNMRNRAITDLYEPGSTFKLITAAAALEEGIVSPETIVDGHNGVLEHGDYVIRDDHKTGKITFSRAMEISSNVVFSELAYKIKPNKLFKYVRDFGFGSRYSISLPSEAKGTIKRPDELDAASRRFLGFGYGISVTSLQMVNAYSSVANRGIIMKPYIVKRVFNNAGNNLKENVPISLRRVVSKNTCDKLTDILVGVVDNGTGQKAAISGLKIAGKTGTAQIFDSVYSKTFYTASFAGYLPANNPQLAILITLNKPKGNIYGGSTAAPIFRNIVKSWLSISNNAVESLADEKDDENVSKEIVVPDLCGLDYFSAVRILKKLNLKYKKYEKNFIINKQVPAAGTTISSSKNFIIQFTGTQKKKKAKN